MAPTMRVKRCNMSTSKFTTIDAFFVNVNKIVHEQSESASFVTLVEIHNVDVPAPADCIVAHRWHSVVAKCDCGKL